MQLKTITSAKDAPFGGVEFVKTDKKITEVIVGGKLRIRVASTYSDSLSVLVAAPHTEEKRWRATATIEGFDPKVGFFDGEYSAKTAFADLASKGATIDVEEVTVLVDDNGDVVGGASAPVPLEPVDDLPF